jgi:mono/diheme cytochrome c family protein
MGWGKRIAMGTAGVMVVGALAAGGAAIWFSARAEAALARTFRVDAPSDIPVPWPLTRAELDALRAERAPADADADPLAGLDLQAIAHERAVARGQHLVSSRLGCADCHGEDFAGGTMVDAMPMGTLLGPNITPGGVTRGWAPADWDRIVRHGIMTDGTPSLMPAQDYEMLSDRELSDVIAYLRSVPPSDAVVPAPTLGPVLTVLLATGRFPLAADRLDHASPRPVEPPAARPTPEFGRHVAQSCRGCHGVDYAGGPIQGGDPAWPHASDLRPAAMVGWTYDDFDAAVRRGKKRAGGEIPPPMPWKTYAKMDDVEVQALWAYFQHLPTVTDPLPR